MTRLVALKVSLWVIPTICTVAAVLLAQGLIRLDRQSWKTDRVNDRPFIFAGGAKWVCSGG